MIKYNKRKKIFELNNGNISYIIKIDENEHLRHLYFGKKISIADDENELLFGHLDDMYYGGDRLLNTYLPKEYASYGTGDFRSPAFIIQMKDASSISDFRYKSYDIYKGKKPIEPLPSTYTEEEAEAQTLEIHLYDELANCGLSLFYTIFKEHDVIARHSEFIYNGDEYLHIKRAMSLELDFDDSDFDFMHFSGAWGREKEIVTRALTWGNQSISSTKGVSSAEQNPSFILKRKDATEDLGEAYGFALLYSGNFLAEVDVSTYNQSRVNLGIHPLNFSWKLSRGDRFTTPEAIVAYSDKGLDEMSRDIRGLFATRLCRGRYRDSARPILLNNWEATEMSFDEDKIISIATKAKEAGAELFVLDDGWFGKRNDEHAGLGDWFVNTDKLPSGISGLSRKIKELGIDFGLWFEPEMVNKDSELYRKHPDYLIATKGRHSHSFRYQYVLDFSREEVVDYIYKQMYDVISDSEISYIKWDMNRYLTEVYSAGLPADEQGMVLHKYMLGVYSLYARLIADFPHILFESCSSGGARFDAGLLYYAPQTWSSDNTDANDRMSIQYASSFFYPISSHGAHVSAVPNAQTNRTTPLATRANIAYFGAFGYELDLNEISEDEFAQVKEQIAFYKENREIFQFGDYYRLISPYENNAGAVMTMSKDGDKGYLLYYHRLFLPNRENIKIRLKGLKEGDKYRLSVLGVEKDYYGDYLMNVGIRINPENMKKLGGDFTSLLIEINRI